MNVCLDRMTKELIGTYPDYQYNYGKGQFVIAFSPNNEENSKKLYDRLKNNYVNIKYYFCKEACMFAISTCV